MREARERAWVEVDLDAVIQNARVIARAAGKPLLPMVKADAYGLGAVAVARTLEALDPPPWGFGVATVDEGAELRAAGVRRPIVVFVPAPPPASLLDAYEAFQLRPVLDSRDAISAWRGRGPFHLEIDTGMGRSGVRDVDAVRDLLDTDAFEGAFTHFHSADIDPKSIPPQLERFQQAVKRLPRRPPLLHAANSPAALRDQAYALDLVRPGIFLYGGEAADDLPKPTPVVSWRARVTSVRQLAKGDTVSYRAEWTAPKATSVATLSVGYADGLPRSLQGRGEVLLGGKRRPIVGRLTMDMIVVDVGGDAPRLGDVATLIGKDGEESITLDEMARAAGTNSYEILTGLGKRLPRVYG